MTQVHPWICENCGFGCTGGLFTTYINCPQCNSEAFYQRYDEKGVGRTVKPTIGRIVYYRDQHLHERAAIVTHVDHDEIIDLAVFYPSRIEFVQHVHRDDMHSANTWDWMPYQKGQAQKTEELEKQRDEEEHRRKYGY